MIVQYKRELKAEVAGVPYAKGSDAKRKPKVATQSPAEKQAAEEQELAKLMMSRKKRKLYDRMQYGIEKKAVAADVLQQKRALIDASTKGSKKRKAPGSN